MKHIALAGLFAVTLAAQQQEQEPRVELATAIAAEEQERNLPKAVRLYREALATDKLDASARTFATQRLAALLRRLGRSDEARAVLPDGAPQQGEDRERERQLRLKARELVKAILEARQFQHVQMAQGVPYLFGMTTEQSEQLLWIGKPAVPEVVLGLQELSQSSGKRMKSQQAHGLAQFLWCVRGPRAARFLSEGASDETFAPLLAANAMRAKDIDIDAPEFRAYLEHDDWEVTKSMLLGSRAHYHPNQGSGIVGRLSADQLLALADRGRNETKAVVLQNLGKKELSRGQLQRAHELVEQAFDGTDPNLGRAAELFVCSTESQQSTNGILWVVGRLPDLHRRHVPIGPFVSTRDRQKQKPGGYDPYRIREFAPAEIEVMLSMLDSAAHAIEIDKNQHSTVQWIEQLMMTLVVQGSENAVKLGVEWLRHGYRLGNVIERRVSKENAALLLANSDLLARDSARNPYLFNGFREEHMSRSAYAELEKLLAAEKRASVRSRLLSLMAATGHEGVIEHLLEYWVRTPRTNRDNPGDFVASRLVMLGKLNKSKRVRDVMHDVLRGNGGEDPDGTSRSQLLMALMTMGDERALDFLAESYASKAVKPPYQEKDKFGPVRPWAYLMAPEIEPKHGFTTEQIRRTIERRAAIIKEGKVVDPRYVWLNSIADEVLVTLAEHDPNSYKGHTWAAKAVARLDQRITDGGETAVLDQWLLAALGKPGTAFKWFSSDHVQVIRRHADRIRAIVDEEDARWANHAMVLLTYTEGPVPMADLLKNRHPTLRGFAMSRMVADGSAIEAAQIIALLDDSYSKVRRLAAEKLGAIVAKDAVPSLIARLRDSEASVRKAAAEALTRIRFYHEQQAHWDRVLKGLDASPASAVEKLLIQAKPGADAEQRLLAIKSLGVLGMPEALPFLIDWTRDADPNVQKAARAAISAIHLKPRK